MVAWGCCNKVDLSDDDIEKALLSLLTQHSKVKLVEVSFLF